MSDEVHIVASDRTSGIAAVLAVRGWTECVEKGWNEDGTFNMHVTYRSLVAMAPNGRDRIPVGVITYNYDEKDGEIFVLQSYVEPEFRGRGIFTALWDELVAQAIKLKAVKIRSGVSPKNEAIRAIAKRQGRRETSIVTTFDVPQL
jgi:ribosomal protein S18 acetylase RimI-like enzyme